MLHTIKYDQELQLFGNYLTGTVPSSISKLSNLKLLSLGEYTGGNNFEPNQIPSCLSTLVNLEVSICASVLGVSIVLQLPNTHLPCIICIYAGSIYG